MINDDAAEIDLVLRHHLHRMLAGGVAWVDIEDSHRNPPRTWVEWVEHWSRTGDDYVARAEAALETGHELTAGSHLMSAAVQYHYAQYMMYVPEEIKTAAADKRAAAFRRAAPHLRPVRTPLELQFKGHALPAFIRLPEVASPPYACVIIIPGLEASKEEMAGWEPFFLDRGMATVVVDGPGQGELTWMELDPPEYVAAIRGLVDHLQEHESVDPERIAVAGPSLGGLLTSMCAASDDRLAAAAEVGGTFDTVSRWDRANVLSKRGHQHKTKSVSFEETREKIATWTMQPLAGSIKMPFLIVHGGDDHVVPIDQSEMYRDAVPHADMVVVPGGNHVCNNMFHIMRPLIADWLADRMRVEA